ncbi:MAG: hypothetical protein ABSH10_08535 [Phycisphaerae bacterium]|jgi:hypothetical protein
MATHFDPQQVRPCGRAFRKIIPTCLFSIAVGVFPALWAMLEPVGCTSRNGPFTSKNTLRPIVLTIVWNGGPPPDDEPQIGLGGEVTVSSSAEPNKIPSTVYPLDGTVEGHAARGWILRGSMSSTEEKRELYRFIGASIKEGGQPVVIIEGDSKVVWRLEAEKEGNKIIIARQEGKESVLPLDLQPGPFHIRIEARDQKKTK